MNPITRETKFVAGAAQGDLAVALLSHYCAPDPAHAAGTIESIYVDDAGLSALHEKTNGDHLKRKIRVRWYVEDAVAPDGRRTVFLEVKDRIGGGRDKHRHAFDAPADWIASVPLHDAELLRRLRAWAAEAGVPLPADAVPTASIRYARRRFVCPRTGARLCVDTHIRSARLNRDLLPWGGGGEWGVVVCEAKSKASPFGPWSEDLVRAGFRCRSFSKYGTCLAGALHPGGTA